MIDRVVGSRRTGPSRRMCSVDAYPPHLLAVAGHGLDVTGRPFPDRPLDLTEWSMTLDGARTHRLTGLLGRAVEDGTFPVTEEQRAELRSAATRSAMWSLRLERTLLDVLDVLGRAGVESRLLKGAAVARLDYPDPALRPFADIDLLVRSNDFGGAVSALLADGFTRPLPEPRPGFDLRFNKGSALRGPAGLELDLHRTFVFGPWGLRIRLDDLWDDGEPVVVGPRTVRALGPRNRILHACYHAALGDWPLRLVSLRDMAALVLGHPDETPDVLRTAAAWGGEAVVAAAVEDTWRLLGLDGTADLLDWAREFRPDRRDVRWLALHTTEDKTPTAQALHGVRAVRGTRDRLSYVRSMLMPDPAYFAGRHKSPMARLWHGVVEARRGRAGGSSVAARRLRALRSLPQRRRAELLQAALLIPSVLVGLRLLGVAGTTRVLERTSAPRHRTRAGLPELQGLARMVDTASAVLPVPSRCLDRSLVTWWMLRRRGLAAEMRIGAGHDENRTLRFHAWVEHDGAVVNDSPEEVGRFVPLPAGRLLAPGAFD